ncbi:ATP-binding protein [Streptomyces noursei]
MTNTAVIPPHTGRTAYSVTITTERSAAPRARQFVRKHCHDLNIREDDTDIATLVIGELFSNACKHTRSRSVRVVVERVANNRLRLIVADRSRRRPVLAHADLDAESGRGLHLVNELTASWGTQVTGWGKKVYAELETS